MVSVRVAYAENIAKLAETALRFLEIVQLNEPSDDTETEYEEAEHDAAHDKVRECVNP